MKGEGGRVTAGFAAEGDRAPMLLTAVFVLVFAILNPRLALGVFVWCRLAAEDWEV